MNNLKFKELVILPFLVFLFFLFEYVGWFEFLSNTGSKLLVPVFQFNNNLVKKIKEPYDFVLFSFNRFKYVDQLEKKYVQALSEISELDKFRDENEELRKLIENRDLKLEKTIISTPVVSLAYPAVGVGSEDGVEEDDMVLIEGMLVGTIDEVSSHQSKVSLLSRKRKNKVLVKTESGVEGVINGDGKNILLTQIPKDLVLINGERVVTIGQKGIEKNILVGTLRLIENNPSSPTQTAVINQSITFYDALLVEVR
jgi:rod shape-determining protein MreC